MKPNQDSQDVKQNASDLTSRDEMLSDSQDELRDILKSLNHSLKWESEQDWIDGFDRQANRQNFVDIAKDAINAHTQKAVTEARIAELEELLGQQDHEGHPVEPTSNTIRDRIAQLTNNEGEL
jgi:hypothetical protein